MNPEEATMSQHDEQRRQHAIARYLAGDKIEEICRQMACAKSWLYKWKKRYWATDPSWARERTRRPRSQAAKTPDRIEQAIVDLRHMFALNGQRCGAVAIQQALQQQRIEPVPSYRTIYRILQRHDKEVY
jgi:transposase